MSNKNKAIKIAMDTFFNEYEGDAVEVYHKLSDETADEWHDVDYAEIWQPFEDYTVIGVVVFMDDLIKSILKSFGE